MSDDLFARLQRLGLAKGTRHLRPAPPVQRARSSEESRPDRESPPPLETLLPGGRVEESDRGACFVLDHIYPLHHHHGGMPLADAVGRSPSPLTSLGEDARLAGTEFQDLVFLDTETTGLAGAGTMAFMVGVAFFDRRPTADRSSASDAFVVRQYFLRDHGDEAAMLIQLDQLLAQKAGLVTFNGRSFDVPLLDNRYLMNRMRGRVRDLAHLDLLPPSRRLWRARVGSCALGSLEQSILGLRRTGEDVPGWMIPTLYLNYLRTQDARPLTGVFYHNEMDMLSMVSLAARMVRVVGEEEEAEALDRLSLARWQADRGLIADAERNYVIALNGDLPLEAYHDALWRLAALYKSTERQADAVTIWQQLAVTSFDTVEPHVELAKYYEWQTGDLAAAALWTEQALSLVSRRRYSAQTAQTTAELNHRLARLRRKLNPAQPTAE